MPRYVRPPTEQSLEAAIDVLGNRVRVAIIGYLQEHGPRERHQITAAVGAHPSTVKLHLNSLLERGVLLADPPRSEAKQGQRVEYSIASERLLQLVEALMAAVGFPPKP